MAYEDLLKWEPNSREQEWLDSHNKVRSYEVSIWTLQDDFITVLKYANIENKGQLQDGKMTLNVDGTQELTFTIPMYIYDNIKNKLVENPIWYNTKNGNIIADMRKIKVIFNKELDEEQVYEFLITKVDERHSEDTLFCDVTCEGLAFHELGKIGYKISLKPEDFYADDYDWFSNGSWTDANGISHETQPFATLQYWLNKIVSNTFKTPQEWYYEINMDYEAFPEAESRDPHIIYEEEYPSSWKVTNDKLIIANTQARQEKTRLVDLEESNIYNLTQDLAENFEVFCRYEYLHDKNYHIIGKKIIFYNNFIYEKQGYIDFTYPYHTSEITRNMDSTDLITKMFVRSVEDDTTASGLLSIIDTAANNTGEDYLLNFDYLHDIKAISEEQYAAVADYEAKVKQINLSLIPIETQIIALSQQLPELEAKHTIAVNAIQLDTERIGAASDLFNALTEGDGEIEITSDSPSTAVLLEDSSRPGTNSYYINLSKHGIDASSIRIFRYFDISKTQPYSTESGTEAEQLINHNGRLYVELKTGQLEYDEFGDVTKIRNLFVSDPERRVVFLTYNYTPKLYYDRVVNTWKSRLAKDTADRDIYEEKINNINSELEELQQQYDNLLLNKKTLVKQFELLMGPALREGYWAPEDYKDCGDSYTDEVTITTNYTSDNYNHRMGDNLLNEFIWDNELFPSEFDCSREVNVVQEKKTYPCINLTRFNSILHQSGLTPDEIKNRVNNLSFFFCDYNGIDSYDANELDPGKMRAFAVGSQCQYGFIRQDETVIPVLILNGIETIPETISIDKVIVDSNDNSVTQTTTVNDMIDFIKSRRMVIGALQGGRVSITNSPLVFEWGMEVEPSDWIDGEYETVYPRMKIDSLAVKTSSDQLFAFYNKKELKNIEDYYCLSKIPENDSKAYYYITIKPQSIFINGGTVLNKIFGVRYVISNADTSIYLDAKKILKENAYPKVSYTIKLGTLNRNFIHSAYKYLCYIAHINDAELKFQNTMGYISSIEMILDKPWEDTVEIINYKTKFEDLFSTIVASTEEMKKSSAIIQAISNSFDAWGSIKPWAVENTIYKADLDYAFNQGNLTIDDKNGIWGVSESGVVAFRGGGIFTATEQDGNGNWKWNTGITPNGINAALITAGQLDTNRVMIYAGDKLRFQLNGEGIFAYHSFFEDLDTINKWITMPQDYLNYHHDKYIDEINEQLALDSSSDLDAAQFVRMDANGLKLIVKPNAIVLNTDKTDYIRIGSTIFTWVDKYGVQTNLKIPDSGIERVSVSWDGFRLKNYYNQEVFFADSDTGNLNIKGTICASELNIGGETTESSLSLNQYFGEPNNLILEGLTTSVVNKLFNKNVTHIFYVRESELINYLNDSLYQQLVDDLNASAPGTEDDIWYNISAYSKKSTMFKIGYNANPQPSYITSDGTEIPPTIYDYWKMIEMDQDIYSNSAVIRALLGIYQSNLDGIKYTTIYKLPPKKDSEHGLQRPVEIVTNPEHFDVTFSNDLDDGETLPDDFSAVDIDATLVNVAEQTAITWEPIPLEEQIPDLASNINLNFGDIWINYDENEVKGIYRWDADYKTAEELLGDENVEFPWQHISGYGKWVLLSKISTIASQDKMIYDLTNTEGKLSRVAHGQYGLVFNDSRNITDIQLNKKIGLQIKSRDGAYFRVNSSQFGFISADGKTPYLYYEDGNLYIMGTIFAKQFHVYNEVGGEKFTFNEYLDVHASELFSVAAEVIVDVETAANSLAAFTGRNADIFSAFRNTITNGLAPVETEDGEHPAKFKPGDIWITESGETYMAMAYWNQIYDTEQEAEDNTTSVAGWNLINDGSLASISGTSMYQDANKGIISMWANSGIHLFSSNRNNNETGELLSSEVDITPDGIVLAATKQINLGVTGTTANGNFAGIRLSDEGILIGSSSTITLFSAGNSTASMTISPSEILFGVIGANTSVVDITSNKIVMGVTANLNSLKVNSPEITENTDGTYSMAAIPTTGLAISSESISLVASQNSIVLLESTGIGIGSRDNAGAFSGIIIRPTDLIMTTIGTVQLKGSNGKIVFGESEDSPKFRVDEAGNIYCQSINCTNISASSGSISNYNSYVYSGGSGSGSGSGSGGSWSGGGTTSQTYSLGSRNLGAGPGGSASSSWSYSVSTAGTYEIIVDYSKSASDSAYVKSSSVSNGSSQLYGSFDFGKGETSYSYSYGTLYLSTSGSIIVDITLDSGQSIYSLSASVTLKG